MGSEPFAGFLRKTLSAALLLVPALVIGAEAAPVAGLAPDARPLGAPVLKTFSATPEARAQATRGLSQPLPPGLAFLKDQGAWYTPFTRPGMPGYYDIRGLHTSADGR